MFEVGQEVAVYSDHKLEGFAKVTKITHGGKRVHIGSSPIVFDEMGVEKNRGLWRWLTISPATEEQRRAFSDAKARARLWAVIDSGIGAEGFERRLAARDAVTTDTLQKIVDLLKPGAI